MRLTNSQLRHKLYAPHRYSRVVLQKILLYNHLANDATNPYSRKIFDQMGFQTLRMIDWKNFVEDFRNGQTPIFPHVDTSAHIKFLKFL